MGMPGTEPYTARDRLPALAGSAAAASGSPTCAYYKHTITTATCSRKITQHSHAVMVMLF